MSKPTDTTHHTIILMNQTDLKVGYTAGILAAAFYGLNPLFALPLYGQGMDAWSVLLFRYVLSLPMLGLMLYKQGVSLRINRHEAWALLLLGFLMAGSSVLLYLSYMYMDAGIASTILFMYPILTAVLMALFYGERMHWLVGFCLALATLGIYVLSSASNKGTVHVSILGVGMVILSALAYALYLIYINRGAVKGMPSIKVTFYVLAMGCLPLMAGVAMQGQLIMPHGWYWACSLGSALLPTALSLALTGVAIQKIGSTETAILGAMEPITAVAVGIIIFSEHISPQSALGIVLIVTAVTIVIAKGGKQKPAYLAENRKKK